MNFMFFQVCTFGNIIILIERFIEQLFIKECSRKGINLEGLDNFAQKYLQEANYDLERATSKLENEVEGYESLASSTCSRDTIVKFIRIQGEKLEASKHTEEDEMKQFMALLKPK